MLTTKATWVKLQRLRELNNNVERIAKALERLPSKEQIDEVKTLLEQITGELQEK